MSITAYRPNRDGNGKILEMRSQESDRFTRDAKIKDLRTYFASHYVFGTFESPELRVDWVIDEFGVCMWWAETFAPVRKGPESYGTIWVCGNCLHHHANGECGDCHDDNGHDKEPLSAIGDGFTVAMGMSYEEHADTCKRHPLECSECPNPATHAVWWQNEDGTREGEPRCGEFECMSVPGDSVAGGTAPIPTPFPVPDDYECDCETNTYSTSQCEGCGSYLHGERYAMTLFKG